MAALTADATPLPEFEPLEGVRRILFTGIGGTGVTTVASILAMAAHIDGRAASVVDMTGLAQKGGSVFSHVKIGEREDTVVGGRVPAASTDVLIACDLLVAASPEGLALFSKKTTRAFGNADFSPTADFVTNRDVRFDTGGMARKVAAATKSYDACPSQALAEHKLGDGIYANMIMLGFTWQRGVIPVSSRAIYRAIKLNGVDYESNLQAFEVGRKAAVDPDFKGQPEDDVATPETMPLDELIAKRTAELSAYQDAAYADRYVKRVSQVRAAEAALAADAAIDSRAAYRKVLACDGRIQASPMAPATDCSTHGPELDWRAETIAFAGLGGGASSAGDMAWTYGTARWSAEGRSVNAHYVRIWQRRADGWKLVFDELLIPPPPRPVAG